MRRGTVPQGSDVNHFEEAVMHCLTANGETFVSSEPDLGAGWSRPDFVAIRPPKKRVYVVEVTASGNPVGLVEKVNAREQQWLVPLRQRLEHLGVVDAAWSYSTLVFVRADQVDWFKSRIVEKTGVIVLRLEEAVAHWSWSAGVSTPGFSFEAGSLVGVQ